MTEDDRASHGDAQAPAARVYAKAVELLALRPHFRVELATKLTRRGFDDGLVAPTLDRLEELGYLDDLATARGFVEHRLRRHDWGPRRLQAELARRGVRDPHLTTVVDEAFAAGESGAARLAAERWVGKGGSDRDRLARYLDRRGFSKAAIVEMLIEFGAEARSEDEEF